MAMNYTSISGFDKLIATSNACTKVMNERNIYINITILCISSENGRKNANREKAKLHRRKSKLQ